MSHILKTSLHQNPNVGLYAFANDKFCLLPHIVSHHHEKEIADVLKVPTYRTNICGTSLLGVFIAGNSKSILIPHIAFDAELKVLERQNVPFKVLMTDHTALGNNILANDHACMINPELEPFKAEIKRALRVEKIKVTTITPIPTIGSLAVLNDKGCLLSALASDDEAHEIEKFFHVPVTRGTVNLGSPYVRSGIIANTHGFVFGDKTGGPEAINIDEALGFLRR